MEEQKVVRVSVRHLVEFLLRSGDLTGGEGRLPDREAMLAGGRIHRKLQKSRGASYRAEAALKEEIDCGSFRIVVEGRADGIDTDTNGAVIEEIKGIYQDVSELETPVPVHLAQAKCYACIYGRQEGMETIRIRMVYCSLETEELRTFTSSHSVKELGEWFDALCESWKKWAALQVEWETIRSRSIASLEFPCPYRAGQRDIVVAAYRSILQNRQLFVQAPTGVGKTLSAVFPAVRALGAGAGSRLFYLTARTVARTVAEEAFSILRNSGLRCKSLTLTAKEKLCVCDAVNCDPDLCPRAKGHFDRINDALYDLLCTSETYTREELLKCSETHMVCPYEMQIDLTAFADAVICDYNYVFDPAARLGRFFGESARKGETILLVDEAHNLVDRSREMFSAALEKETFLKLRKRIRNHAGLKRVDMALSACNRILVRYRKACAEDPSAIVSYGSRVSERREIQDLILPLMRLNAALETVLKERTNGGNKWELQTAYDDSGSDDSGSQANGGSPDSGGRSDNEEGAESSADNGEGSESSSVRQDLLNLYFSVSAFLNTYSAMDDHYLIYAEQKGQRAFVLKLFCVDPSGALQEVLARCSAAVFFSATMLPMRYYETMLTEISENYRMMIPSPFDPGHRYLAIGTDVSTRYLERGPALYARIASYIRSVTQQRTGNYMVYVPSYRMLEDVLEAFSDGDEAGGEVQILAQEPGMREADREAFLEAFRIPSGRTLVGFCVMGGIFAEGIDLAGEQLIGAIVVGTGLPQISGERELLRTWYDRHGRNGFDYAYRYPGLNKVLQAAGRVIRTPEDLGVIVLLDARFHSRNYYSLFPRDWAGLRVTGAGQIGEEVRSFWEKMKPEEKPSISIPKVL